METYSWYAQLSKPSWSPPSWLFGPVWTMLYLLIAISFGRVLYLFLKKKIKFATALPFALNMIFNIAFTPLQFGLQSNIFAMIDIFLVLGTLIWAMKAIYSHERWIAYAQIPYLLWVSFATVLQVVITVMNY
ncbi:MAG: TspO and MBR like protein [Microgenomates group bacterium GW2011_GWF2_45_18]|nr:MAG: TspO and MBR like protein [Microgenomates group bacterium GW2011_GWF1_44_10]KKU01500.1 MAG: TspO and MBR like protein [Microgenomates group bacterium GW2011_GWF2_45_18]OGJ40569.1 MAG: TspO protein [Candidatus Pacebacteria bacterium RIFOXYB1_FULL_44_10]HAU99408.1 tryptophan-rich sensory protein [Candidatus Paceibacterota bacterium]HAX01585.1 tryptophan-rich sensory protein [Candidatus Paceibacterota bacterium]